VLNRFFNRRQENTEFKVNTGTVLEDKGLQCIDCHKRFVWAIAEQEFYLSRNFSEPKRCHDCRERKRKLYGEIAADCHKCLDNFVMGLMEGEHPFCLGGEEFKKDTEFTRCQLLANVYFGIDTNLIATEFGKKKAEKQS
jgi:hypothetical protein